MKISFEIKLQALRAMRRFTSSEEGKYVLNGVHIEIGPARQLVMVATDCRRLGCFGPCGTIAFEQEARFTISNELIDAIPVNIRTLRMPLFVDYEDDGPGRVTILAADVTLSMPPVQGNYPRWRCVVPDPWPETFEAAFLSANMKFLNEFFESACELIDNDHLAIAGKDIIAIRGRGHNGADFLGILMPVHLATGFHELPLWAKP